MSSAIASSILRMFSAWCCCSERIEIRPSLVTPSTSLATSGPNSLVSSGVVSSVSSTVSWRIAATIVAASRWSSARMLATSIGWLTYSSPDRRRWPVWALAARWYAFSTSLRSSGGRCSAIRSSSGAPISQPGRVPQGGGPLSDVLS